MSDYDFWVMVLLISIGGIATLLARWTAEEQDRIMRRLKDNEDAVEDDDSEEEE